jgi:hypothetical protein
MQKTLTPVGLVTIGSIVAVSAILLVALIIQIW